MKKNGGLTGVLSNNSGASFIFVLGIMLLLMAIGVSALVASGSNVNFGLNQTAHNQAKLIADSVQENILFSLQQDTDDPSLLSSQIAMALYEANLPDASGNVAGLDEIELEMGLDGFDFAANNIEIESILLTFPRFKQMVLITEEIPAMPEYDDAGVAIPDSGLPAEPRTAAIVAEMTSAVRISVGERTFVSEATYEYSGGLLTEVPDGIGGTAMVFAAAGDGGEWELIKYEAADL